MTEYFWVAPLIGGALIGLAATVLLALEGRVLGVSGIIGGIIDSKASGHAWRWAFLLGMLVMGLALRNAETPMFSGSPASTAGLVAAGFLVGFGTRLGSGCTSGHGRLWYEPSVAAFDRGYAHIHGSRVYHGLAGVRRSRMRSSVIALVAGMIFALGLGISGMTLPAKVIGFLNLTGNWDPSLAFVMMGAIAVHALAYHLWLRKKARPLFAEKFRLPEVTGLDRNLLIGAVLFGVGWGIGGFCPGPALVSLVSLDRTVVIFVASMLAGMALFQGYSTLRARGGSR